MKKTIYLGPLALIVLILLAAQSLSAKAASTAVEEASQTPKWSFNLPGEAISSSPALADINQDGRPDVIVATTNGYIVAINHSGSELWRRNLAGDFGVSQQSIFASPAVADIDNNGDMEIVITTGSINPSVCHPGGAIVLDHLGNRAPGSWPFRTIDDATAPAGCPDGVSATPALADIDKDGDLEIIFGAFDKRLYALHHNGTLVGGFPINSFLQYRFPTWDFNGKLADTIWSSPAVGDIDKDGFPDIVSGSDEGNFGRGYGGETIGFYCPYTSPWGIEYCGGALQVVNRNGQFVGGNVLNGGRFPKLTWEIIQSTPALADLNGDSVLDIIVGSGDYYHRTVSGGNPYANRVHVINGATGGYLQGWNDFPSIPNFGGGKATGSPMMSSPAIGDIDGDGQLDVAILGLDNKLYAWNRNGQPISGFPMTPRDSTGKTFIGFYIFHDMVMGDYDGDGDMEMFFQISADLVIVDGNGQQLTSNGSNGRPSYRTGFIGVNAPALGDLDNNGRLEVVVARSKVVVWELPNSTTNPSWPMFKRTADRQSRIQGGMLATSTNQIFSLAEAGSSQIRKTMAVTNAGSAPINWNINTTNLKNGASVSPRSGTLNPGTSAIVQVTMPVDSRSMGSYDFGTFTVNGTNTGGQTISGSPKVVDVDLLVVDKVQSSFIPVVNR